MIADITPNASPLGIDFTLFNFASGEFNILVISSGRASVAISTSLGEYVSCGWCSLLMRKSLTAPPTAYSFLLLCVKSLLSSNISGGMGISACIIWCDSSLSSQFLNFIMNYLVIS